MLISVRDDNEKHRRDLRDYNDVKDRLNRVEREKESLNQGMKSVNDVLNQTRNSVDELTRINKRQ